MKDSRLYYSIYMQFLKYKQNWKIKVGDAYFDSKTVRKSNDTIAVTVRSVITAGEGKVYSLTGGMSLALLFYFLLTSWLHCVCFIIIKLHSWISWTFTVKKKFWFFFLSTWVRNLNVDRKAYILWKKMLENIFMAPGQGGVLKQSVKYITAPKEIFTNICKREKLLKTALKR